MDYSHIGCKQKQGSAEEIGGDAAALDLSH